MTVTVMGRLMGDGGSLSERMMNLLIKETSGGS